MNAQGGDTKRVLWQKTRKIISTLNHNFFLQIQDKSVLTGMLNKTPKKNKNPFSFFF
jgi:hypothetical protein